MIPSDKVIVAMDFSERRMLTDFYRTLEGQGVWVKIGMELYYSFGPDVIAEAKERGFKVFLDLKLHDIPNTVGQGIKALCRHGVEMVNIHAAGGSEMMKRASDVVKSSASAPLLIAVTQLTSTTSEQMNKEQLISGKLVESVTHYAKLAKEAGCDGVVSSPLEVQAIKQNCGVGFLTITPGIRPAGSGTQDQKRTTTPQEALAYGADFLVIGRPITGAENPRKALEDILKGVN